MRLAAGNLEELMALAIAGDRRAYAVVLEAASRFLRPYLSRHLNSVSDVEEVLQETLLSLHRVRHTYDGRRPFKPWAFAIARYRLQDFLRKLYADRLRFAGELDEAENIMAADVTDSAFSYESIKEEVERLPGKQPQILYLMHEMGHTSREVAEKMNMTESAVKVAAYRAYKVLRKKLGG